MLGSTRERFIGRIATSINLASFAQQPDAMAAAPSGEHEIVIGVPQAHYDVSAQAHYDVSAAQVVQGIPVNGVPIPVRAEVVRGASRRQVTDRLRLQGPML